jgi:hypothetical protein
MALATSLLHAARNLGLNVQAGLPKAEINAIFSSVSCVLRVVCYCRGRKHRQNSIVSASALS